jgi:putative Ca2+/H+ antiporter (TMEM165/GDT1 family)
VISRHHCPSSAIARGQVTQSANSGDASLRTRLPACAAVTAKTPRFSAISSGVSTGLLCTSAPAIVRGRRTSRRAAPTHSTHW